MTVGEACTTLEDNSKVNIVWNGYIIELDRKNGLMIDAFKDYIIERMHICKDVPEKTMELIIAAFPKKWQTE